MVKNIPPLPKAWLDRMQDEAERRASENPYGGCRYFADEYDITHVEHRSPEEVAQKRVAIAGEPVDTLIYDAREHA